MRHFTPHDLRRTFYTENIERGVDIFVLEKIVNHTITGTMAHYNLAEYWPFRVKTLNDWGTFLSEQFD